MSVDGPLPLYVIFVSVRDSLVVNRGDQDEAPGSNSSDLNNLLAICYKLYVESQLILD